MTVDAESLLLPTGLTSDGKWESSPIDISFKTNKQLLDLIRGYGLKPKGRNKESYKQCLEEFSRAPSLWDTLKRPEPNMHKGPRRHHRASNLTSPLKNPLNAAQHAAYAGYTSLCNPDTVDTRESDKILTWAEGFSEKNVKAHSKVAKSLSLSPRRSPEQGPSATSLSDSPLSRLGSIPLTNLVHDLKVVHNATQNLLHAALGFQAPTARRNDIEEEHDQDPLRGVKTHSEPRCDPDEMPVTLVMQDCTITISSADIPDPPPLHCHGNIELINAIWDDDPATWNHSSPLRINGTSIPLVYWRALYSYRRSKQWSGLKQRWSEYKFLIKEYRGLGKSDFWAKYSANGATLPMSTILKSLRKARRRVNDATAENVRKVFGENFNRIFCYKKHRTTSVIHNDGAITRRYHAMVCDGSD